MAEIPNNHLGWCWNPLNNGISYQPQLVSRISAINSTTKYSCFVLLRFFQAVSTTWNIANLTSNPNRWVKVQTCGFWNKKKKKLVPSRGWYAKIQSWKNIWWNQWLFLVPLKGGIRWHSPSPNWQEKYHLYTTYSPCLLPICYRSHLLGEPETTIDERSVPGKKSETLSPKMGKTNFRPTGWTANEHLKTPFSSRTFRPSRGFMLFGSMLNVRGVIYIHYWKRWNSMFETKLHQNVHVDVIYSLQKQNLKLRSLLFFKRPVATSKPRRLQAWWHPATINRGNPIP